MKLGILSVLLISFSFNVIANDVIAHKGETLVLPINKKMGTLLEFPVPLKLIPASANFRLSSGSGIAQNDTTYIIANKFTARCRIYNQDHNYFIANNFFLTNSYKNVKKYC